MRNTIFWSTFVVALLTACGGATTSSGGSGGGVGTGGAGGSAGGGSNPDAGSVACSPSSVTFQFDSAGSPAITYCVGKNCGVEWLTVKDASGQEMALTHNCMSPSPKLDVSSG